MTNPQIVISSTAQLRAIVADLDAADLDRWLASQDPDATFSFYSPEGCGGAQYLGYRYPGHRWVITISTHTLPQVCHISTHDTYHDRVKAPQWFARWQRYMLTHVESTRETFISGDITYANARTMLGLARL